MMMVTPNWLRMRAIRSIAPRTSVGLSPANTSSSRSRRGWIESARAISRRFFFLQRQVARQRIGALFQPDEFDQLPGVAVGNGNAALTAPVERPDPHILDDGHTGEGANDLKRSRDPQLCDRVRSGTGNVAPIKENCAFVRRMEPGDHAEQGALARSVWTDQSHQFAGADLETDVPQRRRTEIGRAHV